jgi:uridylate kinase
LTLSKYQRIVLKLSGEALMGDQGFGISPEMIKYVAEEVRSIFDLGVQIALVVGGGIFLEALPRVHLIWTEAPRTTWGCWLQ